MPFNVLVPPDGNAIEPSVSIGMSVICIVIAMARLQKAQICGPQQQSFTTRLQRRFKAAVVVSRVTLIHCKLYFAKKNVAALCEEKCLRQGRASIYFLDFLAGRSPALSSLSSSSLTKSSLSSVDPRCKSIKVEDRFDHDSLARVAVKAVLDVFGSIMEANRLIAPTRTSLVSSELIYLKNNGRSWNHRKAENSISVNLLLK